MSPAVDLGINRESSIAAPLDIANTIGARDRPISCYESRPPTLSCCTRSPRAMSADGIRCTARGANSAGMDGEGNQRSPWQIRKCASMRVELSHVLEWNPALHGRPAREEPRLAEAALGRDRRRERGALRCRRRRTLSGPQNPPGPRRPARSRRSGAFFVLFSCVLIGSDHGLAYPRLLLWSLRGRRAVDLISTRARASSASHRPARASSASDRARRCASTTAACWHAGARPRLRRPPRSPRPPHAPHTTPHHATPRHSRRATPRHRNRQCSTVPCT